MTARATGERGWGPSAAVLVVGVILAILVGALVLLGNVIGQ